MSEIQHCRTYVRSELVQKPTRKILRDKFESFLKKIPELELSLEDKTISINNLRDPLDERSIELSDAEARYSVMECTLLHSLARTGNENNEIR
jgi:hypothetical protein